MKKTYTLVELDEDGDDAKSTGHGRVGASSALVARSAPPISSLPSDHSQFKAFIRDFAKAVNVGPNVRAKAFPFKGEVSAGKPPQRGKPGKKPGKRPSAPNGRGFLDRYGDYRVKDAYEDGVKAWRFIKKYMNVEEKMFDVTATGTASTYNGSLINLSNVAQGSDYNNRDGNSILIQRIRFVYNVISNTAAQVQRFRLLLLRDMLQNDGTDPTPAEILQSVGSEQVIVSPLLYKHDGNAAARRFRVLLDETMTLISRTDVQAAGTTASYVPFSEQRHHELRVGAHTMYGSTAGADASNWVGAIYVVFFTAVASDGPTINFASRIYFTDN